MNVIIYEYLTAFLLSFLIVYALTPFMIKFALAINFVDQPSARKIHKDCKPLLGGLAVFIGFATVVVYDILLIPGREFNLQLTGYLGGAFLLIIIGLIDDRWGMQPKVKLLGQVLAAMIFLISNDLMTLLGPVYVTVPIFLLWMVGLINAFNFLDNMDGILSGMSGILAIGFYTFAFTSKTASLSPQVQYISLLSLAFSGAAFGFLPHNFNPAKIFLGDTGSMFIGYFLASMGILSGRLAVVRMNSVLYYLLPVLLLSYALFDITLVSYTRKRDGRKISEGGKDHSTHRIGTAMQSAKITALLVYLINTIILLVTAVILKMESETLLVITTCLFATGFIFFGKKLDNIPIIITKNQLKKETGK